MQFSSIFFFFFNYTVVRTRKWQLWRTLRKACIFLWLHSPLSFTCRIATHDTEIQRWQIWQGSFFYKSLEGRHKAGAIIHKLKFIYRFVFTIYSNTFFQNIYSAILSHLCGCLLVPLSLRKRFRWSQMFSIGWVWTEDTCVNQNYFREF